MVNAFYVEKKIARGCCVWKLKLALVLLDLFETCIEQNRILAIEVSQ